MAHIKVVCIVGLYFYDSGMHDFDSLCNALQQPPLVVVVVVIAIGVCVCVCVCVCFDFHAALSCSVCCAISYALSP